MPFRRNSPANENDAVRKLVDDINGIEAEKNKVGRYVLLVFGVVFLLAATLLGVLVLSN
jgi:hypothetical protein